MHTVRARTVGPQMWTKAVDVETQDYTTGLLFVRSIYYVVLCLYRPVIAARECCSTIPFIPLEFDGISLLEYYGYLRAQK